MKLQTAVVARTSCLSSCKVLMAVVAYVFDQGSSTQVVPASCLPVLLQCGSTPRGSVTVVNCLFVAAFSLTYPAI